MKKGSSEEILRDILSFDRGLKTKDEHYYLSKYFALCNLFSIPDSNPSLGKNLAKIELELNRQLTKSEIKKIRVLIYYYEAQENEEE